MKEYFGKVERQLATALLLIAFYFCSCHEPVGLLVFHDIHIIAFSSFHALFLLTERAEKVFHESPLQESTILVGPCALEPCKLADFGQRALSGGHKTFVLVEIQKHFQFLTYGSSFGHITCGQQDLTFFATI